jgi:outer membrane protein assembly factor BamA
MKYFNLHNKQAKMEKESNKETLYLLVKEGKVYKIKQGGRG